MSLTELTLALIALLAAPGPTNALLAMAGARGFRLHWLVLVLAAYLCTVVPLTLWGGVWLAQLPQLKTGLSFSAALWVALLAARLWRRSSYALDTVVTPAQLALTTVMNPKALVFGLVLLPQAPSPAIGLGLFATLVLAVSTLWLALGASLPARARPAVNRGGALWLAALAVLLAGRAVAATLYI